MCDARDLIHLSAAYPAGRHGNPDAAHFRVSLIRLSGGECPDEIPHLDVYSLSHLTGGEVSSSSTPESMLSLSRLSGGEAHQRHCQLPGLSLSRVPGGSPCKGQ